MNIFAEIKKDGTPVFSWRKAGTAITFFVFAIANVGYLIANDFKELPSTYQAIIAGVFAFYFGKDLISGKKLTVKERE